MKVIFLDIDGVMNTRSSRREGGLDNICQRRVEMLHQLITDTGAKVVLSSTWRTIHTIEEMSAMLRLQLFGYTPVLGGLPRGNEIDRWLYDHDVESFAILDDCSDMEPHIGRLVQTTDRDGLTWRHCRRIKELLS